MLFGWAQGEVKTSRGGVVSRLESDYQVNTNDLIRNEV